MRRQGWIRLYNVFFIVAIASLIWEIRIYRLTFVYLSLPLGIFFSAGLIATVFGFKRYALCYPKYKGVKLVFGALVTHTLIFGSLCCSSMMLANYYLRSKENKEVTCQIVDRYSMSGSRGSRRNRKPVFEIEYNGFKKELIFSNPAYANMYSYTEVHIKVATGLFGYDVVLYKELIKED